MTRPYGSYCSEVTYGTYSPSMVASSEERLPPTSMPKERLSALMPAFATAGSFVSFSCP